MWSPLAQSPKATGNYLVGWWAAFEGEEAEPFFVQRTASYSGQHGWEAHPRAQVWHELPAAPDE